MLVTQNKSEDYLMFSSNSDEKRALKRFLKNADKKGIKNKLVNPNEKSQDEDEEKIYNKSNEFPRKQMHVYLPTFY